MRLEDDDFEDYDEGGYNDDDRAFDELMDLVPTASEDAAWDALEQFDFDIPAAAAHLKAKAKPAAPKVAPKQVPKAAPKVSTTVQTDNTKGKSKLQSLALKKQIGTKGGALGKLRMRGSGEGGETPEGGEKKSALARLIAKKNDTSRSGTPSAANSQPSSVATSRSSTPLQSSEATPIASKVEFSQEEIPKTNRPDPSPFGSLLGCCAPADPYCASVSNAVKVTTETSKNFAKPSPDDTVVNAQAKAFETPAKGTAKGTKVAPKKKAPAKTKVKDIEKIASLSLKPSLNFVVLGHVDAGKSTLTGRILIDVGAVPKSVLDKNVREAKKMGKESFALAWVMDATTQERARGVTVDVAKASFETEGKKFTILDAPGHKDYVPNMITGVSQADLALIVIDASKNAFESGFLSDGQTKEHAILARSLGIDSVIVAINKLDADGWSEGRFHEIKIQVTEFLSKVVGFNSAKIQFVPTSGVNGDYVVKTSSAAPWYKGPTLLQALESTNSKSAEIDAPFRVASFEAYEDLGGGVEVTGLVISGTIETNDPIVNCNQPDINGTVVLVNTKLPVVAGDTCNFVIKLENDEDRKKCHSGDLFTALEGIIDLVHEFTAQVIFFDLKRPVLSGSKLSFYMGSVNRSVKVSKILSTSDKKGNAVKKNPRHITRGQAANIQLTLDQPLPLCLASTISQLGRFVLRLNGDTIGAGVVSSIL